MVYLTSRYIVYIGTICGRYTLRWYVYTTNILASWIVSPRLTFSTTRYTARDVSRHIPRISRDTRYCRR